MVGPRIGASIVGTPVIAVILPMFLGPAADAIISCPTGMIMPPPTPWSTRKAISSVVDVANAAERRAEREHQHREEPDVLGAEAPATPSR